MRGDDLLIPESVVIRVFNEKLGTNCKTLAETQQYLKQHPEARRRLMHSERSELNESQP